MTVTWVTSLAVPEVEGMATKVVFVCACGSGDWNTFWKLSEGYS